MRNKRVVKRKRYLRASGVIEKHCICVSYIVCTATVAVDKQTCCVKSLGDEGKVAYLGGGRMYWCEQSGPYRRYALQATAIIAVNISPGDGEGQFTHIKKLSPVKASPPN
jgi:hypothetical protein